MKVARHQYDGTACSSLDSLRPVVHVGCGTKSASVAVPPAPSRVPNQYHLPRASRQSRLSANDKFDKEEKAGSVHRYTEIYLTAEANPGKHQLGDRMMKAV